MEIGHGDALLPGIPPSRVSFMVEAIEGFLIFYSCSGFYAIFLHPSNGRYFLFKKASLKDVFLTPCSPPFYN